MLGWVLLERLKAEWAAESNHLALDVEMAKAFAMSDRFAADDALLVPFELRVFRFHCFLFFFCRVARSKASAEEPF